MKFFSKNGISKRYLQARRKIKTLVPEIHLSFSLSSSSLTPLLDRNPFASFASWWVEASIQTPSDSPFESVMVLLDLNLCGVNSLASAPIVSRRVMGFCQLRLDLDYRTISGKLRYHLLWESELKMGYTQVLGVDLEKVADMAMTSFSLKEKELKLAVFQNSSKQSLFFDRIFMDAYGKADDRIDEEE